MLSAYLAQLVNLVQTPQQPIPLISTAQQTTFVNAARQQVAGDGECVRCNGALPITGNTQSYRFGLIGSYSLAGVSGTLAVRQAFIGGVRLDLRSWEWFSAYYLNSGNVGIPQRAAQQGQGTTGTLFFDPVPNAVGSVVLDVVGLPTPLASDSDPEAIPYPWTDAVPFYAAWLGFQNLLRQADAEVMMVRFKEMMRRARQMTTPTELPDNLPGGAGAGLASAHAQVTEVPGQQAGRGG